MQQKVNNVPNTSPPKPDITSAESQSVTVLSMTPVLSVVFSDDSVLCMGTTSDRAESKDGNKSSTFGLA